MYLQIVKKHIELLFLIIFLACNSHQSKQTDGVSFLDDCDIIATIEVIDGDSVIICDYNKIRQKKNVPLDELVTDFTILLMDNESDDGFLSRRLLGHIIGDKYILVSSVGSNYEPIKLYDKQGKYIRRIGGFGQGPGEYIVVNDIYMDEKNDRIYVLPLDAEKLLVYDFEGNVYPPIPLVERVNYGNSIIPDIEQERLIVTKSPRTGATYSVWVQDFQGNFIQGVEQADYFSDEITTSQSTITRLQSSNIEYYWLGFRNTNEYLYNYSMEENRLVPKFRIKNMDEGTIFIYELPHHFVVEVATSTWGTDDFSTPIMIVDKHTLKGCHFDGFVTPEGIVLDQYDILFNARHGYFGLIDFGSYIEEKIKKVDREALSSKNRKKLENLQQLIDETDLDDDCSLLLYGKFKQ